MTSIIIGLICFFALSILKPAMYGIHPIVPTTVVSFLAFIIGSRFGAPAPEDIIRQFWGGKAHR